MTPQEALERRKLVRSFRAQITVRLKAIEARFKVVQSDLSAAGGFHGGIEDDAVEERRRDVLNREYDTLAARIKEINDMWFIVEQIFGRDTVMHAIEEGQERIGELPYVK